MPDWLDQLRANLTEELGRAPKVATLATVGLGNSAEARSIVVRQIDDDGSLTFTTHHQSEKVGELSANPAVAVLFWLPKLKRQYRINGLAATLAASDPRSADQWRSASDAARAMFFWPPPGEARDDAAAFPSAVSVGTPMPDVFDVLMVSPSQVETLDLGQTPHRRQRWMRSAVRWTVRDVNP